MVLNILNTDVPIVLPWVLFQPEEYDDQETFFV